MAVTAELVVSDSFCENTGRTTSIMQQMRMLRLIGLLFRMDLEMLLMQGKFCK
jgi:hypothetical protein